MTRIDLEAAKELRTKLDDLTKRYNEIAKLSLELTNQQDLRELKAEQTEHEITEELDVVKKVMEKIDDDIKNLTIEKKILGRELKEIVKEDQIKNLNRKIDQFKFEEYASKDQFERETE
ncbi:hypothetical protein K9L97_00945 [Candidatus Woesearchaeota archaeon]|nr:hypothetical protein [Candidatus Woesearchaeota archaeon]